MNALSLLLRGIRHLSPGATWDSITHQIYRWRYHIRSGRNQPPGLSATTDYLRPGDVVSHARQGRTASIMCANGSYALTVLAPNLIRVRLHPAPGHQPSAFNTQYPIPGIQYPAPSSYSIAKPDHDWPPCDFHIVETEAAVEVRTRRLVCQVAKVSGRLAFLDPEGNVINEDEAGAGWHSFGQGGSVHGHPVHGHPVRIACRKRIQPGEHFYGLGERTFGLDRRGRRCGMWNTDPQTYQLDQDPTYLCMPVLLGLHSQGRQGYGLFFDNTFRGYFDLGAADPDVASFEAEGGELRYYFVYGPALTTVVERYTELTGRTMLPPLWVLPLFVRAGSVVPMAPSMQYVSERPVDTMALHVYPGDGVSWLYEDDGESLAHRQGEYRLTHFNLAVSDGQLHLTREVEGPFDPGYDRLQVIVHGLEGPPIRGDGWPGAEATYVSQDRTLRMSGGLFDEVGIWTRP